MKNGCPNARCRRVAVHEEGLEIVALERQIRWETRELIERHVEDAQADAPAQYIGKDSQSVVRNVHHLEFRHAANRCGELGQMIE